MKPHQWKKSNSNRFLNNLYEGFKEQLTFEEFKKNAYKGGWITTALYKRAKRVKKSKTNED